MHNTIRELKAERDRLREALLSSSCPYPVDGKNTIGDCIRARNCGCNNQAVIEGVKDHTQTALSPTGGGLEAVPAFKVLC